MILSARILEHVTSVNDWDYAQKAEFTQGDTIDVYFQLVDLTKDRASGAFKPAGRRFVPVAGATLQVVIDSIDDAVKISRTASLAFPSDDRSIWKVSVLASDKVRGTCALVLALTQSGVVTNGRIEAAVLIHNAGTL